MTTWTRKKPPIISKKNQRQEKHPTKCMKCLTFLDYATLRSTNKNIEQKLEEKDGDCGIKTEI
jgi:hypothetical protein